MKTLVVLLLLVFTSLITTAQVSPKAVYKGVFTRWNNETGEWVNEKVNDNPRNWYVRVNENIVTVNTEPETRLTIAGKGFDKDTTDGVISTWFNGTDEKGDLVKINVSRSDKDGWGALSVFYRLNHPDAFGIKFYYFL